MHPIKSLTDCFRRFSRKTPLRLVLIESPFAGATEAQTEEHVRYARACISHCLQNGESALASHLLYTQPGITNDNNPDERRQGIEAGLAWYTKAEACIVYTDYGISKGMEYGIERARKSGLPVEFRKLPDWKPALKTEINTKGVFKLR